MSRKKANADASGDMEVAAEGIPVALTPGDLEDEIGSLARELAQGHSDLVDQFQRYADMDAAEAAKAARTPRDRALGLVRTESPERLSWSTLS